MISELKWDGLKRKGQEDKAPKEKVETIARLEDPHQEKIPKFLSKNRSGFSGGFKIPEEQRKK